MTATARIFALLLAGAATAPAATPDYERDILPIFEKKCLDCHSAAEKVKGGLKLDDPTHFQKRFSKNDVVVPGDWDASLLFVTITRPPDDEMAMPPKDKGEPLTEKEIRAVATWIYEGARIDGKRGERGPKEDNPEEVLKFKDGKLVTEVVADGGTEPSPLTYLWDWTNAAGKSLKAYFVELDGENVVIRKEDGTTHRYPLAKLSEKSQRVARNLAELKQLEEKARK